MTNDSSKIFPRNLTARAGCTIAGNPAVTRTEDAVANCFPGLEIDVRNLDRRFFPGLVFEFVVEDDVEDEDQPHFGGKLAYVDPLEDPDLQIDTEAARGVYETLEIDVAVARTLLEQLKGRKGEKLSRGDWYLHWISQGSKRISMSDGGWPLDGLVVWRLVRSLEPGPVKICLKRRDKKERLIELAGWRRLYADPTTGVISAAYQPGELTQGLCSPWQHDFRDCACYYWASNHPDAVYGEIYPGESTLPGGRAADPERANVRLDWLRADRDRAMAGGAFDTITKNRRYQLDHFEINKAWQKLDVVVGGTEIGARYLPESFSDANPFANPADLASELQGRLAPLELTLTLEYLYAMFSLVSPEEVERTPALRRWGTLARDMGFVRHHLMQIATSEMQHLRYANQLLWELRNANLIDRFEPVLALASKIPDGKGGRAPELRRLEPCVLKEFIAAERPSSTINGAYARVAATLRQSRYPAHLSDLAERIISDGMDHESRFQDIKRVLKLYNSPDTDPPYLRQITPRMVARTRDALAQRDVIIRELKDAYANSAQGKLPASGQHVVVARAAMQQLHEIGEELALKGVGIPFFEQWPS